MESSHKRRLIKPVDIMIILIVLLFCIMGIYLMSKSSGENLTAQISFKGKIIEEIDLNTSKDMIFKLSQNENVSFQISSGKIRFVDTDCPDKLCENFGYLDKPNQTAICLPNMVSLRLIGKKIKDEDVDIIAN